MVEIHLQKYPRASEMLSSELPDALNYSDPETIEHSCPQCGGVMRYPVIAREQDIERLESLLTNLEMFAKAFGATGWMVAKAQGIARAALQRNEKG